jgi:hyaluronan synthase
MSESSGTANTSILPFDAHVPEARRPPSVHLIPCIVKVVISLSLVISVIVCYALSFKVFHYGPVSLGLYGVILVVDFAIQFTCALLNRLSVNRIAAKASGKAGNSDSEKGLGTDQPRADLSIAVVGYREDTEAWRKCLRSLQQQTLKPRSIIAVVDGDEEPDMVMADAFAGEFERKSSKVIKLPVLLSSIYQDVYTEVLAASGEKPPGRLARFWRWIRKMSTPGEIEAHQVARERIRAEVTEWDRLYDLRSCSAVCFAQPHRQKRVSAPSLLLESVLISISGCYVYRFLGGDVCL